MIKVALIGLSQSTIDRKELGHICLNEFCLLCFLNDAVKPENRNLAGVGTFSCLVPHMTPVLKVQCMKWVHS